MHRSVRRKDREISPETATRLLAQGEYGFLATADKDGQAYGVPLNYVFKNNSLFFHCAPEGHKMDNIRANNKVSFCVVGKAKVLPDKFSTDYESVIAFGTVTEVQGEEKSRALSDLVEKYSPDYLEEAKTVIAKYFDKTSILKMDLQHITGKARG
jgi:nitroimidazol reductase NimA-like FMN-containing flavoprotein (pyridoxamine 5'-phosphate oxidase superfamily)